MNPGIKPSGLNNLSSEEIWRVAEQHAISEGALKPQGMKENMAAGVGEYNNGPGWFASTALAQGRLRQWTIEILRAWGYNVVDS